MNLMTRPLTIYLISLGNHKRTLCMSVVALFLLLLTIPRYSFCHPTKNVASVDIESESGSFFAYRLLTFIAF